MADQEGRSEEQTVQSKDDLSSFAMPHLDGGDRVGQQMELDKRVQSSDSLQGVTFTTPPNSPTLNPKNSVEGSSDTESSRTDKDSLTSYEKAVIMNPSAVLLKEDGGKTVTCAMPQHVSSPVKLRPPLSSPPADLLPGYPNIEIVNSSPAAVRVGFFDASVEATNPGQLPGSSSQPRDGVITTPPHLSSSVTKKTVSLTGLAGLTGSSHDGAPGQVKPTRETRSISPRARSIEEVDKEREKMYVPKGSSWQEKRKASATPSQLSLISLAGSIDEAGEAERLETLEIPVATEDMCAEWMSANTCYDLIPPSTKIVVFDTRLRVKKAFFALVTNGIRAAPLWEHSTQELVGMLTITDFINILRHHYKSPIVGMDELENQTIRQWRDSEKSVTTLKSTLVQIDPGQSLYDAVKKLVEGKIHRLPVIDKKTGNPLHVLTHKRLLHFLYTNFLEKQQPAYMHKSIGDLGIGTFNNIATACETTPIILALNTFQERRVSALPIVNAEGKAVDIYAKFDVINLAAERSYNNLDITLKQALSHRALTFSRVHTCLLSESLFTIVQRLVIKKVHRLIVVSDEQKVIGVVSLSDVLKFLVITPHEQGTDM